MAFFDLDDVGTSFCWLCGFLSGFLFASFLLTVLRCALFKPSNFSRRLSRTLPSSPLLPRPKQAQPRGVPESKGRLCFLSVHSRTLVGAGSCTFFLPFRFVRPSLRWWGRCKKINVWVWSVFHVLRDGKWLHHRMG